MSGIDAILGALADPSRRRTVSVRLPINVDGVDFDDLIEQHARADLELADALQASADRARLDELRERVEATEQAIEDAKTEFRFQAVGAKAWADLVAAHPPTAADRKVEPRAEIHADTFYPAAIAASAVEPEITVEQAEQLRALLPDDLWTLLGTATMQANIGGGDTPKSLLAGTLRRASERSATTAAREGSPGRSSSAAS